MKENRAFAFTIWSNRYELHPRQPTASYTGDAVGHFCHGMAAPSEIRAEELHPVPDC